MTNNNESRPIPMYQSYSTFTTFLDWVREMEVMPSQIDRSLWVGKFAGGSGGQLMAGLRFLKLLDGEKPTDVLGELVEADTVERKERLGHVLRGAYGDDVIDKLPTMTPNLLNQALDDLGATDHTRRKAFSFVVNAAKAAELSIAAGIAKKARNKPSSRATSTGTRRTTRPEQRDGSQQSQRPPATNPPSGAYAVVHTLVDQLPSDRQWTKVRRERWLQALTSNVDWLVEVEPDPAGKAAVGDKAEAPGPESLAATPGASEGGSP